MSTGNFYDALPVLDHFLDLLDEENYAPIPDDWYVLITDIAGSTKAIDAGLYKEVNLLGASSIIAVLNAVGKVDIPFVFGGDGASLAVPPTALKSACKALLGIRKLALSAFNLDLRVGVVPVEQITAQMPLKVAKLRISPKYSYANFLGGGITYATNLIKADHTYQLEVQSDTPDADLSGLECRWQSIPSQYGQTISLIVSAMLSGSKPMDQVYRDVVQQIQEIYGTAQNYHPVAHSALKMSFHPKRLGAEIKARSPSTQFFHRFSYYLRIVLENLLGWVFMHFKLTIGDVDWGHYKQDLIAATDYQKIDDMLRMVIAGTPEQTEQLTDYLEQRYQAGDLTYGLHISDRALMTCLILDRCHRHIHLIDAADGGYALAAKHLKQQLHRKAKNWKTYTNLMQRRNLTNSEGKP